MDFAEESPIAAFLLRARREGLRISRLPVADERLPDLQGIETLGSRGNGAPRGQRSGAGGSTWRLHRWSNPCRGPSSTATLITPLAAKLLPKGCGGVFSFSLIWPVPPAPPSSRPRACSRTWPTWRRQVAGDPSGQHHPLPQCRPTHLAAAPKAPSASRWASRTPRPHRGSRTRPYRRRQGQPGRRCPDETPLPRRARHLLPTPAAALRRARPTIVRTTAPATTAASGRSRAATSPPTAGTRWCSDLPGHGQSAGPQLTTIEAIADWASPLDELKIPTATLAGHSIAC